MTRYFTDPELIAIWVALSICFAALVRVAWIDRQKTFQEIKDIAHDWLPPTRRR